MRRAWLGTPRPGWQLCLGLAAALSCWGWSSAVHADGVERDGAAPTSASAPAMPRSASTDTSPVRLVLRGDALDLEKLQAALAVELRRDVVSDLEPAPAQAFGVLTVTYRRAARELAVSWERDGQTLTRVVAAPPDESSLEADATLLAGNLAREQVEQLLVTTPPAEPPTLPEAPPAPAPDAPEYRYATAGVFYPLATHIDHPEVTSSFDINLLYGRVGAIDGAQIGLVNVITRSSGIPASMHGLQLGFLANLVGGEARGVQLGTAFNQVSGAVRGLQLAFGANVTSGPVQGVQGSALFNRAEALKGLQVGAVNVAGNVDGVQIGIVNVAQRMRGLSVGLVNVADDIEGLPIAPFSVSRTGGVHPLAWSASSGVANGGVKFATRYTYTLLFGSYHRAHDLEFVGGGFALGGSVPLGAGFRSNLDLMGTYLIAPALSYDPSRTPGYHEQMVQPRLRLMFAFRAAEHFGVFAGGAAVGEIRSELGWDRVSARVGPEIFGGIEL